MRSERRPRRAPAPEERGRAAERTRERILQAAVEEFGAKGYSGARTAGIAARAGVNQQLISYYFGGKQGLLDELRRRWASFEGALVPPGASLEESFSTYLDATLDRPDWARLVIWQALGDNPGEQDTMAAAQLSKLRDAVQRIEQRQESGEVTGELRPEFILLLTYALTFAPIALPQIVEGLFGVHPHSPEYRRLCREQLSRILNPATDDAVPQESNRSRSES